MTHWCTTVSAAPDRNALLSPRLCYGSPHGVVFAVCCVVSCYRIWLHVVAGMILARLGAEMMKAMDAVWTRTLCRCRLCAAFVCSCDAADCVQHVCEPVWLQTVCRRMCASVSVRVCALAVDTWQLPTRTNYPS